MRTEREKLKHKTDDSVLTGVSCYVQFSVSSFWRFSKHLLYKMLYMHICINIYVYLIIFGAHAFRIRKRCMNDGIHASMLKYTVFFLQL